jgi:hypothetical protein
MNPLLDLSNQSPIVASIVFSDQTDYIAEMICTKAVQLSTASARLFSCKQHTSAAAKFPINIRSRRVMSTVAAGREVVSTENAPGAVGPYSQAIKAGGFVYISGQVPLVPGVSNPT